MFPYTTETRAALRRKFIWQVSLPQLSRGILKERGQATCEKNVVDDIDQRSYLGLACVHVTLVDYVFLTGSLTLLFENSTRFALTFSDSLTSRIFERIDTAGGDNCNAAFLLALAFAGVGNAHD